MELKPGYKQTEVGVIPEDWDVIPIGQAGEVLGGRQRSPHAIGEPTKYLRVANVFDGFIAIDDVLEMPFTKPERQRFSLKSGDILLNEGQSLELVGRSATYRGEPHNCCFQNTLVRFRAFPGTDTSFAQTVFQSYLRRGIFAAIALQTTSIAHLGAGRFAALKIPRPPLPEQRAIAEALNDANALIESLEQLITKKRFLKQGAMQDLLTCKKRLPGFNGDWEVKRLEEIAHIKTGSRNNEDKIDDGVYPFFVRSQNVERINTYSHECEAILVPGEGNIGNIFHYINGRFDVHQRVYAITQFSQETSGKYVYFYMAKNFGSHAMQNSVKATVDSLRLPTFQNFEIAMPPTYDEQTAIATVLSDMDAEIADLESQLAKTRGIKQGMMHKLLTGEIRLR
ncbi:MAG: restriction endonuclease subunit S [Burkholderiaceae bacterium]|nr:restriction endonuclease subunit S [Burkholderiaceae bacterium]